MIALSDEWRIRPLDELQWVIERRAKAKAGRLQPIGGRWQARAYCRTKAGLKTAVTSLKAEGFSLDTRLVDNLPVQFPEPAAVMETLHAQ